LAKVGFKKVTTEEEKEKNKGFHRPGGDFVAPGKKDYDLKM
jgi:hypothetical protein